MSKKCTFRHRGKTGLNGAFRSQCGSFMDFSGINSYFVATQGISAAAKDSRQEVNVQAHGHFEMQRQGQLLICRPSGPFNLAGAMAYEGKFSQQISRLQEPLGHRRGRDRVRGRRPRGAGPFSSPVQLVRHPWLRLSGGGHDRGFQTLSGGSRLQRASLSGRCAISRRKHRPSTG